MWGLSFLGTTVGLETLNAMSLLAVRWAIATVIALAVIVTGKVRVDLRKPGLGWVLLTGAMQPCIYSILETYGISMTSTSMSSIIIALIPCMTMILGALFFKRKLKGKIVFSILLAFAGVTVGTFFSPNFSSDGKLLGVMILMGAVVAGGFYGHFTSRACEHYSTMEITCIISIMSGVIFNIISLCMGNGITPYIISMTDLKTGLCVLFLGAGCSTKSYFMMHYIISKMDPSSALNLTASLTTSIGVVSGILFAGDPFGWYTIVGLAMTLTGVYITSSAETEITPQKVV